MSWWREEREGNKKYIVIGSFNLRFFLGLLAFGIVAAALMMAAVYFEK